MMACVFIKGSPSDRDEDSETLKMIAGDVFPFHKQGKKLSRHINVMIDNNQNDESLLSSLKELLG